MALLGLAVAAGGQDAPALTVIVVRHAEKAPQPADDPPLSTAGIERAARLAEMLARAPLSAVFASDRRRTQETVAPTARGRDLVVTVMPAADPAATARAILERGAGTILVAAHSNTIAPLIAALGGPPLPDLAEDDYGNLFVVTVTAPGQVALLPLRY